MDELVTSNRISRSDVADYVASRAFRPSRSRNVGLEVELFVLDLVDRQRIPGPDELRKVLGADGQPDGWLDPSLALPGGSRLTFEPGGQLELSGPPAPAAAAIAAMSRDVAAVQERLATVRLRAQGGGLESTREPRRWVRGGRYDAMAAHFRTCGAESASAGAVMMTATAALQLNLDAGDDDRVIRERWDRAHVVAPVLAAMFAASPVLSGRPVGAASGRLEAWHAIEPCRTAPVPTVAPGSSPGEQWAEYALAATVFFVRDAAGGHPAPGRFTLAEWIADPTLGGRPVTVADVDYHLTTLFPPVRPRGFLELRYLDGQHLDDWPVAAAVAIAVHDDRAATAVAADACAGLQARWAEASRLALADPPLASAAIDVMDIALASMRRNDVPATLITSVEAFAERYTRQGRCPADDFYAPSASAPASTAPTSALVNV